MKPTKIRLYDLAGAKDDRRFSPNCWRVRLALLHKQLPFETIPWRFTEKETIAFSGQGKVPVIVDGERFVCDSWAIAEYLEESYPENPPLFDGLMGKALSRFVTDWVEAVLNPEIIRLVITDIYSHLHPKDKDYFRRTREEFFGTTLEALSADRDERVINFHHHLEPLRRTLQHQSFLAGKAPAWADYVVFSSLQWARCISPFSLLVENDPVFSWREQMLDTFDKEGRQAIAYSC
ncbi:glutathione S-transferase family protein [Nostocaceae cyanobacterium CENA357]|uniref:Glutathione S-transferase family protein n=1 Tax=Atlanticothrix silvestris CENA357 TaxID=1725252 RepID=A0A8J7H7A9_9CYAN|nr:glutathione S-transferase family protein [Atlanticothrix silvestris]MBH8551369.1 glutathione S-transferase family protein [Atlanticothrix silvestris CENA357]